MNLAPIIATSLGIALYRGLAAPLGERYRQWRNGPRVMVARRNWRGRYIPDLLRIRMERLIRVAVVTFAVFAAVVAYTALTHPPHR